MNYDLVTFSSKLIIYYLTSEYKLVRISHGVMRCLYSQVTEHIEMKEENIITDNE